MESLSDAQRHNAKPVSEEQDPQSIETSTALENGPVLESGASSVHVDQGPADTLNRSVDSREFVWKFVESLLHRGAKQAESPSAITIVIATVLFGLFVAQAIAGVF